MKKILFIICSFPFFLFGSDEQLQEIIDLLKYRYFVADPNEPWIENEFNYTMSDFLKQNQKTSPYVENYFQSSNGRGTSFSFFSDFLFSKGIVDIQDFLNLSSDEQQKLYFEFYQNEVVNILTQDYHDYCNGTASVNYLNPLMLTTMSLSKIALSLSSGSSSGGSSVDFSDLLFSLSQINNSIISFSNSLQSISKNATTLPMLDGAQLRDWVEMDPDRLALYRTNKLLSIAQAFESLIANKMHDAYGNPNYYYSSDFLSTLNLLNTITNNSFLADGAGGGGGGLDDPVFKSSVTNSLKNISTNSTTVVDILNKILEQISKMQTNQSSIADSIYWMTNNFPDEVGGVLPPGSGGGGSNDVWHVWDVFANNSSVNSIKVPSVVWDEIEVDGERVLFPRYDDLKFQPSQKYDTFWREYQNLLDNAKAGSIDGQEFLAGVEIFSMRFLADISSQLMILNSHIPSKTNLWGSIEDLVENKIPQEINSLEGQINGERSKIETLNRVDSVSKFVQPITKVKTAISKLKPTSNDRVIRIPLPDLLSISGGDWVIDLEEINGYPSLRRTIRFICAFIYTLLFIRTLIVPCMILICLGVRLMDSSLGLLFFDDTTAVKVVGEWTANAFDIFCHLIGLDTDFKKWAVGIKT